MSYIYYTLYILYHEKKKYMKKVHEILTENF